MAKKTWLVKVKEGPFTSQYEFEGESRDATKAAFIKAWKSGNQPTKFTISAEPTEPATT